MTLLDLICEAFLRQAEPRARRGARPPSDTFPVSQIAILTDGTPSAIERARTVVQVDLPGSVVWTASQVATDAAKLGRVVTLGVFGAMLLAGATLAIAVITGLVERRRPFALLAARGDALRRLKQCCYRRRPPR
ncbi:MAG: hypothetical protein WKF78_00075 [Candidatus Limnocylindrales bacterium]